MATICVHRRHSGRLPSVEFGGDLDHQSQTVDPTLFLQGDEFLYLTAQVGIFGVVVHWVFCPDSVHVDGSI